MKIDIWIFAGYAIAVTLLNMFAYREAYLPTIIGGIIVLVVMCTRATKMGDILARYFALCLVIMISSLVSGVITYRGIGNPLGYITGEFAEGQFWMFVFYYAPLALICIVLAFIRKPVFT
ncbi:MAG TPA: hypothetical protein VJU82_09865 [Acidobacteriaceae bacterium]|nr:hypothetical protein [Acidobacteriaceae bacterium]